MRAISAQLRGEQVAADLIPAEEIIGNDEQDTRLLHDMLRGAREYISSFSWCSTILSAHFAGGFGGIFAIFFFNIRPNRTGVDPWIWIIIGDIPPAYLPITDCISVTEVFRTYIAGMKKWVELAKNGTSGTPEQGVPPVDLPASPENAEIIDRRLNTLILLVNPPKGWA